MKKETYEALKKVVMVARLQAQKLSNKKRKTQDEIWESATLLRDIYAVQSWIDEVAKEYKN